MRRPKEENAYCNILLLFLYPTARIGKAAPIIIAPAYLPADDDRIRILLEDLQIQFLNDLVCLGF